MKIYFVGAAVVVLALALNVGTGRAATFTYNDVSGFNAATTGQVTSGFNGILVDPDRTTQGFGGYPSLTINGNTFTGSPLDSVNINAAGFYGSSDLTVDYLVNPFAPGASSSLTITFAATTAFGLDFTTLFNSTTATFTLSNGTIATVLNTVTIGNTPEFIGFVSTDPFTSVTFSVPVCDATAECQSWVVADVVNAVAAVPEPSTWAMLILGFAGVGFMAHRRGRTGSAVVAA